MNSKNNHNIIKDWASDFKSNNESNYNSFIKKYFGNLKFYSELAKALETKNYLDIICKQLHSMVKVAHKFESILDCLLDLLPLIIKYYFVISNKPFKAKKHYNENILTLKSCLVSVFKLLKHHIRVDCFKMEAFNKGSIYHSAIARPDLSLLNCDVDFNGKNPNNVQLDHQDHSRVLSNCVIISNLLSLYAQRIDYLSSVSLNDLCLLATRICSLTDSPRISIQCTCNNSQFTHKSIMMILLELIYFILFKENHVTFAIQAIKSIEMRAEMEMNSKILLVITSIQTSLLRYTPANHPFEGPIGIHTFVKMESFKVAAITNASFRPQKVAEDIAQHKSMRNSGNNSNDDDDTAMRAAMEAAAASGDDGAEGKKKKKDGPIKYNLKYNNNPVINEMIDDEEEEAEADGERNILKLGQVKLNIFPNGSSNYSQIGSLNTSIL